MKVGRSFHPHPHAKDRVESTPLPLLAKRPYRLCIGQALAAQVAATLPCYASTRSQAGRGRFKRIEARAKSSDGVNVVAVHGWDCEATRPKQCFQDRGRQFIGWEVGRSGAGTSIPAAVRLYLRQGCDAVAIRRARCHKPDLACGGQ